MCTHPHPFATKVFEAYIERNLGDPRLFPKTAEMEKEVVSMLGELLSHPNVAGYIVTGGTEANIMALWVARNFSKKRRGAVVASEEAHFSIAKACDLLGLEFRVAPCRDYVLDVEEARKLLDEDVVAVVGVAGTTGLGLVDPIEELAEVAEEAGVYLHVDAAFGGLVLPFLKELGAEVPRFDFSLEPVQSMTVDPHKMGLAPIPAGAVLFRREEMLDSIAVEAPYLTGGLYFVKTLSGTRSGASAIAAWALFKHLGKKGYRELVARCMKLTEYLVKRVEELPDWSVVAKPVMNLVGVRHKRISIERIMEELTKKGWAVSRHRDFLRIVVMPHLNTNIIDDFIQDLVEVGRGG